MKITLRSIVIGLLVFLGISGLVLIVLASILSKSLGDLIGGFAIFGSIVIILFAIGVMLFTKFSAAKLKIDSERHRHIETMAQRGFLPAGNQYAPARVMQIEAPRDEPKPEPATDPRHALLVSLCRITIRSKDYGPTSPKLMTADDAQADTSGLFADRMNWDKASKYGQGIGMLYTQTGGKSTEQGLKIHGTLDNGDPVDSAADLLVALHEPSLPRRAAITALPPTQR